MICKNSLKCGVFDNSTSVRGGGGGRTKIGNLLISGGQRFTGSNSIVREVITEVMILIARHV